MQTDKPLRIHDLPDEARRIAEETERLLQEINGRGISTAALLRAKDLRQRQRRVKGVIAYAELAMEGVQTAFRERVGRDLQPDESFTEADLERAKLIVAALESKAGEC